MLSFVTDTLSFSVVKAHLSEMADRVERQHDRILVTRYGRPSFVLISPDDLESLEETLDIMSSNRRARVFLVGHRTNGSKAMTGAFGELRIGITGRGR